MADNTITTSGGTTVRVHVDGDGETVVILDNPGAPDDMRDHMVGRIISGGFQPAPFALWAGRPDVLRAIADLIEGND